MESSLALVLWFLVTLEAQLVCWQALIRCHEERECELAYSQYLSACDGILRGDGRPCPSHCIGALIRLNQTSAGPGLESCGCGPDPECLRAQRAIEPCLPRTLPGGMGCTEARQRCEDEPGCRAALTAYLTHCGQLFNGRKCPTRCRAAIQDLLLSARGVLLNSCVCDGLERPFCEVVKQNMAKLCSAGDHAGPPDHEAMDDAYEDEDYELRPGSEASDSEPVMSSSRPVCRPAALLWGALALAALL